MKVGDKVKWNDPGILDYAPEDREEVLNRVFEIVELDEENNYAFIYEVDGVSEAEVYLTELVPVN